MNSNTEGFTDVHSKKILKKKAITSYGIICFTLKNGIIYYLLGQIRDTIGFKEFLRSSIPDTEMIKYISNMSIFEKQKLLNIPFHTLVEDTFLNKNNRLFKSTYQSEQEFSNNLKKYNSQLKDNNIGIIETPWIFPKGRKQDVESDTDSALREFIEETQCSPIILCDSEPLETLYYGLDGKLYKIVYYCGFIDYDDYKSSKKSKIPVKSALRETLSDEISSVKIFTYEDCMKKIIETESIILKYINEKLIFDILNRQKIHRRHSF